MTRSISRPRLALCLLLALLPPTTVAAGGPVPQAQAAAYLQQLWRSTGTPAISAAVSSKGKIVFSEGVGYADLDNLVSATDSTVYNIGSVSKANTAVAVMQLFEQGKISLDDPIQKYVPTFPDKGSPITIKHLMTHTSGIRHYRPNDFPDSQDNENMRPVASLEEGIKIFKDDPLLFKPGEYFFYSSYAVNLLQGVIEKAGGLPFEDYMRQSVWIPAGMLSTAFDVPERTVPHRARSYRIEKGRTLNYYYNDLTFKFASGGMISTASDLVRLGAALNHGRLLKPETVTLMYTPQPGSIMRYQVTGPPDKTSFQQGLLWQIRKDAAGRPFVYHCGSVKGFNACLLNSTQEDLVVAIVTNSWEAGGYREVEELADFFRAPEGGR
ncbi:MAG: serine hydrolase domain-containing protein [Thermoanaerobaculia bacterium]